MRIMGHYFSEFTMGLIGIIIFMAFVFFKESSKKWLSSNKIFFETILLAIFSYLALLLSMQQNMLNWLQIENSQQQTSISKRQIKLLEEQNDLIKIQTKILNNEWEEIKCQKEEGKELKNK